jgi:6,7-dimethyl-8-ribityllumazine synthase
MLSSRSQVTSIKSSRMIPTIVYRRSFALSVAHLSLIAVFFILPTLHFQIRRELYGKILQPKVHQGRLNAEGFRFALVASRWNDFLTSRLVEGALDALERLGADEKAVELFRVPGSFEIPLLARKLAASGKWDAVVCLGTIIRGQTPHFEYLAGEVTKGIAQAGMETDVPVVYGIVTADTLEQAIDRAGVKAGNKGFEAAMSAVELVNLYQAVTSDK